MVCSIDLGLRKIARMNVSRFIVLPKVWINHHHLEMPASVSCRMTRTGDLLLSPVIPAKECQNTAALEQAELAGTPAPEVPTEPTAGDSRVGRNHK